MSEQGSETKTAEKALPKTNPLEQFVVFVSFLLAMLILIEPGARQFTGNLVGAVLEPTIGFGHAYPVLTIVLASAVMVLVTSTVRHYFTDYLKAAKAQDTMRAFSKEMRDARKENNLHKMKKLTEMNKELMTVQAEQSSAQMKPMAITMIVAIPIFAWLLVFVSPASAAPLAAGVAMPTCQTVVAVPWDAHWCLDINVQTQDNAFPLLWIFHFFPRWVALYSLFSIPLGQVVQRTLRAHDLRAELGKMKAERAA